MLKFALVLVGIYVLICGLLFLMQSRLIFIPNTLAEDYAFNFAFTDTWEEIWIEPENARLHGLYFPSAHSQAIVLYFHGNAGSVAEWGGIAPQFLSRGYDLLLPDYRGYGKSTGKLSQKALLEDADRFFHYIKERYPNKEIILMGRSLGSGIASYLASVYPVRQLILESPYVSLSQLSQEKIPWLPVKLLLRYPIPSIRYLQEVRCPVSLIHGTDDEIIPFHHSQRLRDALPREICTLHTIEGGMHNDLDTAPSYSAIIDKLLPSASTTLYSGFDNPK